MKPRALIVRSAGTNCDGETAFAFEQAGAQSVPVHLNRLIERPQTLKDFQILAIPGGFSYGDDIAAGKILARQLAHHLREALHDFVADSKPIIGICNGFQVLVKTDLLPGGGDATQLATLTNNDCGHFVDRWIHLAARSQKCIWTAGLAPFELPIAHGEGKFVPMNAQVLEKLHANDQIALEYVRPNGSAAVGEFPHNPNGSVDDIAGICDSSGLVFGLMPHPERFVQITQHPAWQTREMRGPGTPPVENLPGQAIFARAVAHCTNAVGSGI